MKHTKGEWFAVEYCGYWTLQPTDQYSNDDLLNEEKCPDAEANAKLAASAPELLKTVTELLKVINRTPAALHHYGEAIKMGEAAIQKAKS